jgi:hypothetical protein
VRTGKWRRVGTYDLSATVHQEWARQPALTNGLVPLGWRGRMTIFDPNTVPAGQAVGAGQASELGLIDPRLGLYVDLTQSWDVEFSTAGGRYSWRHRCTTRVLSAPSAALPSQR